jgi:hypothetical protein
MNEDTVIARFLGRSWQFLEGKMVENKPLEPKGHIKIHPYRGGAGITEYKH